MAAETGFMIDGTIYEVPALDSLTMSERRLMYELAGITQEDFVRAEDEDADEHEARVAKLMRHPGLMETLMQVAYQRGNPTLKQTKVRLVIEQTNFLEAVATMADDDEEPEAEAVPLALTPPPAEPSANDSSSSAASSEPRSEPGGTSSENGSEPPGSGPQPIGTTRSATSSISDQEISAA